jgi:hypothetical protein
MFTPSSSTPQSCWSIVATGIRLAVEMGAHRRKMYSGDPNLNDELWKRTFWVLVIFDRTFSATLGQPCTIQDEDFDLDLPVALDDSYWEPLVSNGESSSCLGVKPSLMVAFICLIQLNHIFAFALRTIVSELDILPLQTTKSSFSTRSISPGCYIALWEQIGNKELFLSWTRHSMNGKMHFLIIVRCLFTLFTLSDSLVMFSAMGPQEPWS